MPVPAKIPDSSKDASKIIEQISYMVLKEDELCAVPPILKAKVS